MSGYRLRTPCPKCPFRSDVPSYIRGDRAAEILRNLGHGSEFPCHLTTVPDPDDDGQNMAGPESQFCAGALIMMEKAERPNQMMRIAERIGLYDPKKLDMDAPVLGQIEFVMHHSDVDEEDESPACSVGGDYCEAPAGWLEGDAIVRNTELFDDSTFPCKECGEPVCKSCSSHGVCEMCQYS